MWQNIFFVTSSIESLAGRICTQPVLQSLTFVTNWQHRKIT